LKKGLTSSPQASLSAELAVVRIPMKTATDSD
jgi:hypothetical protein